MNVQFYTNFRKRKNSTLRPTGGGTTINCYLKEDTDLINPHFILNLTSAPLSYTYCVWQSHYYFIDDIIFLTNNTFEMVCSIDALATYKSDIGSYTAFVERSASNYDNMINDPYLTASQTIVSTGQADTSVNLGLGCYIFSVFNRYGINWYCTTNLGALVTLFNNMTYDSAGIFDIPMQWIAGTVNWSDWVGLAMWIPYNIADISTGVRQVAITCGYIQCDINNDVDIYRLKQDVKIETPISLSLPTNYYDDFRKANDAFSSYTLYLPAVGTVQLPAIYTVNNDLSLTLCIDFFSGSANYLLWSGPANNRQIIAQYNGQIGVEIPMSSSSGNSNASNILTSALNVAAAYYTGGESAVANAGGALVGAGVNAIQNAITRPANITGGNGNRAFSQWNNIVRVTLANYGSKEYPTTVAGRPLYQNVRINTLSGYVKCANAAVNIYGTLAEKILVDNYLNTGFYYE